MSMNEQRAEWIAKHPDATIEEAWQGGYSTCTNNWCRGKAGLMAEIREMIKQLIE